MIAKSIKYKDFNGNDREDKFYFNLTEAECTELAVSAEGGLDMYLKNIIMSKNQEELIHWFKKIILKSYGEKTADGKRFRKTDDNGNSLSIAFSETEAYSKLFMELATNDEKAAEFVTGIIPGNIDKAKLNESIEAQKKELENM